MTEFLAQSCKVQGLKQNWKNSPQGLPEGQLHRAKEKSSDLHFIVEMGAAQSIDKVQTQNELKTLLLRNIKF